MWLRRRRILGCSAAVGTLVWLAACSSHADRVQSAVANSASIQRVVTPRPVGGSAGKGPVVVPAPSSTHGEPATQQVVLGSSTLTVNGVTQHTASDPKSTLVDLNLVLQNNGDHGIVNQSTSFELIGPDGDTFANRSSDSGPFYGSIGGHAVRTGIVEFEVPKAATSGLNLIYRPGPNAQAAMLSLKVA